MSEKKIVGHVDPSTHAEHLRLLNEVVAVSAATHVAHRPNVPAVRLWSNPAFAPEGHFTIPKFNGVATEI